MEPFMNLRVILAQGHANLLCIVPVLVYVLPKRARRQILYLNISSPGHPVTPRRLPSDVGRGASSTEERPSSWLVLSECPLVSRTHRTGAGEVGDADVASAFRDFKLEMGRRMST